MAGTKIDGNGCKIKFGSGTDLNVNSITIPGWQKQEIDDTDLGNASVMTAFAAALKKYNNLVVNADFLAGDSFDEGNVQATITFPQSKGTLVCWADLLSVGDAQFQNGQNPACDYTFVLTNRNATGVITAPVLTISLGS